MKKDYVDAFMEVILMPTGDVIITTSDDAGDDTWSISDPGDFN